MWEKKLRKIESGEFSAPQFIKEMEELVGNMVNEVLFNKVPEPKPLLCPKCKKGKIIKGKTAYGCSEWKADCTFRIPFEIISGEEDIVKLISEGKISINGKNFNLQSVL